MRRILKSSLMSATMLVIAEGVAAQVIETQSQLVEIDAFSVFPGVRRLDPAQVESGEEMVNLPVRLPVVGLGDALGEAFVGLEAEENIADTFIFDTFDGFWTSQEVALNSGTVYVEAERRGVVSGRPGGSGGRRYTVEEPQIQFLGDDMIEVPAETDAPAANEVVASFELGGVQFRVMLVCHAHNLSPCADETEIRRLVSGLEVLGRGTMQ